MSLITSCAVRSLPTSLNRAFTPSSLLKIRLLLIFVEITAAKISIMKSSFFCDDTQLLALIILDVSDDLCFHLEFPGKVNDRSGIFLPGIDLKTMSHVEHFVHFIPVGLRLLPDNAKQRRDLKHIVLYDMHVINKLHYLGLTPSRTMDHTMDGRPVLGKDFPDYRGISPGGRHKQFTRIRSQILYLLGKHIMTV